MKLNLQDKIHFFSELITCSHYLRYWRYDSKLNCVSSNCQEEMVYDALFSISGCKEYLRQYLVDAQKPLVLIDSMGLMWIATFERQDTKVMYTHIIGPAFIADISVQTLEKNLSGANYSIKLKNTFIKTLRALPVLSVNTYFQYGQMLHYTVNEEKIQISDFHFQIPPPETEGKEHLSIEPSSSKTSHGTWTAEQELLRMVEEGNLDYQDAFNKISVTGSVGQFNLGDPFRQAKDYALVFVTLCSRAAMRAGLSPELAYTLSDFYIQSIENTSTIPETQEIGHVMYHDYVNRVHELKLNTHVSKQIQDSCNYIQVHSTEKLSIADIAEQVGYAEYYFSKKFKKEMGISVKEYIKQTKVNRAKIMLRTETVSIQDAMSFS